MLAPYVAAVPSHGGDVAVGNAFDAGTYFHDSVDREFGQVGSLGQVHVVAAAIQSIDDQVRLVMKLAGQTLGRDATDDRAGRGIAHHGKFAALLRQRLAAWCG